MLRVTRAKCFDRTFLVARNRGALTELNYVVNGSNIRWRGRSHAASVPSDVPKFQRDRKKVTKDERKAMVESFVNKYRATHYGKFPTTTDVVKNVGGSYYVLKIMLQELVYKSKTSSPDERTENSVGDELLKEHKVSVDENTQNEVDKAAADNVEIGDASDKHLEVEGGPLTSSVAERNLFEEVKKPIAQDGQPDLFGIQSNTMKGSSQDVTCSRVEKPEPEKMEGAKENHLDSVAMERHPVKEEIDKTFHQGHDAAENGKNEEAKGVPTYFVATERHRLKRETEEVSHPSIGNADEKMEGVPSEDLLESEGTKHDDKQSKGSPELKKNANDVSNWQTNDEEVLQKSTLWGNLKSLAGGFFRMWQKP